MCVCMFEQGAMFVLRVTVLSLLLQRWNVLSLWTVYSCVYAHAFVWVPDWCVLMVLMHAEAEHWGVALLSVTWKSSVCCLIHSEPEAKKEGIDRFFVLTVVFIFLLEFTNIASTWWRVCACVSPVWVSSLLGVHSESQSFGSHACQLLFSPLFSSVFHALRGWVLHVPAGEGWSWCDRVYSCASVWVYK